MANETLIKFENIGINFKDHVVLSRLNLDINKNEIFGFIGPSGCGKTTLLRILVGFYKPDSGKIIYQGHDLTKGKHILKEIVGFTTQENSFYPELSIQENLRYYGRLYGVPHNALEGRIERLLDLVSLNKARNTPATKISGGMKRRLDFAISLIHDPEILVLDEPATGLDPVLVHNMWSLIDNIRGLGKTIIVSSHRLDLMERYCTRIGFLNQGSFQITGTVSAVKAKYGVKSLSQLFGKVVTHGV